MKLHLFNSTDKVLFGGPNQQFWPGFVPVLPPPAGVLPIVPPTPLPPIDGGGGGPVNPPFAPVVNLLPCGTTSASIQIVDAGNAQQYLSSGGAQTILLGGKCYRFDLATRPYTSNSPRVFWGIPVSGGCSAAGCVGCAGAFNGVAGTLLQFFPQRYFTVISPGLGQSITINSSAWAVLPFVIPDSILVGIQNYTTGVIFQTSEGVSWNLNLSVNLDVSNNLSVDVQLQRTGDSAEGTTISFTQNSCNIESSGQSANAIEASCLGTAINSVPSNVIVCSRV